MNAAFDTEKGSRDFSQQIKQRICESSSIKAQQSDTEHITWRSLPVSCSHFKRCHSSVYCSKKDPFGDRNMQQKTPIWRQDHAVKKTHLETGSSRAAHQPHLPLSCTGLEQFYLGIILKKLKHNCCHKERCSTLSAIQHSQPSSASIWDQKFPF